MAQHHHHASHHHDQHAVAQLLREVCAEMAGLAGHHLPGLAPTFANNIVVVADSVNLAGEQGNYTIEGCQIAGKTYDKLSISLRHPAHADASPETYAANLIVTLAHELAHAHVVHHGHTSHAELLRDSHNHEFEVAAEHLGLEIARCAHQPGRVFTPRLTPRAHRHYRGLIGRLAGIGFTGTSGIGFAGPHGLHGHLHPNIQASKFFSLAPGN